LVYQGRSLKQNILKPHTKRGGLGSIFSGNSSVAGYCENATRISSYIESGQSLDYDLKNGIYLLSF